MFMVSLEWDNCVFGNLVRRNISVKTEIVPLEDRPPFHNINHLSQRSLNSPHMHIGISESLDNIP
jgi:hypothetical protein